MRAREPITIPAIAPLVIVECDVAGEIEFVEVGTDPVLFMIGEAVFVEPPRLPEPELLLLRLLEGDSSTVCMTCTAEQKKSVR